MRLLVYGNVMLFMIKHAGEEDVDEGAELGTDFSQRARVTQSCESQIWRSL